MPMWYLGADTQLFILAMVMLYYMKKYEDKIPLILGGVLGVHILALFSVNYYHDFGGAQIPTAEKSYLALIVKEKLWHLILGAPYANVCGIVAGLWIGHVYYRYKDQQVFTTKIHVMMWWFITFGGCLGIMIIPGSLIYYDFGYTSRFWASFYVGIGRSIFSFCMAVGIFGMSQGVGWAAKWACEFSPTYILGRVSYSAFLVHMALQIIRPAILRAPVYITDYMVISTLLSDLFITYIVATIFTLLFEMPISELQKSFVPQKEGRSTIAANNTEEKKVK